MFPVAVLGPERTFGKEEHEAHQEHRYDELSHDASVPVLTPLTLRSQPV